MSALGTNTAVAGPSAVDARTQRLRELLDRTGLDAVVATSDASIYYLGGFRSLQLERLFALVVRTSGGGALIVPALDGEAAKAAPTSLDVVAYGAASDGLGELLAELAGAHRVGVEQHHLSFARSGALIDAGLKLEPAAELVMGLRSAKDAGEIELIRRACGEISSALEGMFERLRPGDVERVVNAEVDHRLRSAGASETHTMILFGPNAARPHGEPGERTLAEGDVISADVSARFDGYWGDLTRCGTVGEPDAWARDAWGLVREAQEAAIAACTSGTEARAVDAAQRRLIEGAASLGRCLHGAGHAIGVEVHEPPFLVPSTAAPLVDGTVLTIEPGIYRPGIGGIRLEDDVLVTSGGPELLSQIPLELREVAR